jgi:hypothetical protein
MKLEPLKPYKVVADNTDGSIIKGEVVWLSKDSSLNVVGEDANGFFTPDELTPEIMDFEAVLCNVYKLVKIGNDEHLIMREQTPKERESVQNYIKSISERVVPVSQVKKWLEEIKSEIGRYVTINLSYQRESHTVDYETVVGIINSRIWEIEYDNI